MKSFKTYRHLSNPQEKLLHDTFLEEHISDRNCSPDLLIFEPANPSQTYAVDTLNEREKRIMLGTIQWLGSPVGRNFLSSCGYKLEK